MEFDRTKSKKSLVFAELICDFPHFATENVGVDSLPDESLFLIALTIFGMGISLYISKPRLSSLLCLVLNDVAYAIKLVNKLSSVILFIVVGLTLFFEAASCLTKPRKP